MPSQKDLRKHFEAIVGHKLVGQFADEILLRQNVGLHSAEQGSVVSAEIGGTGNPNRRCAQTSILVVSGLSVVDADGSSEIRMSQFLCGQIAPASPVIFLATPQTSQPVFVTAEPAIIENGSDVRVVLRTWGPDGAPAPNTLVAWTCRFRSLPIIL
jgi:hypothetical protein